MDVLINFVGKTDDLQPVENILSSIAEKGAEVREEWKKTSDAMDAGSKKNVDSTSKLAKSIDALGVAAKSADKVVVAGAYKQYLAEIQRSLGLTSKELIAYIQNARQAAQQAIFAAGSDEEANQLTLSIQVMNDQLKELGASEDETSGKTQTLKSRLKEARDQLVAMADAGLQGTPAFEELRNKAGELDDRIRDLNATIKGVGSDTKNIDGLISLAGGIAGGFAVAQGAAALFGDGEEEIQKALLKVNAAMSILQGWQEIQNVLQKESAASLLFNTGATEANAAAITTQAVATEGLAVAEGTQAIATEGATAAQIGLNAAMLANPVGLLVAGLVSLVALFGALDYAAGASNREINKHADALQREHDLLVALNQLDRKPVEERIKQKENENEVLKAGNVTAAQSLKLDQDLLQAKAALANSDASVFKDDIKNADDYNAQLKGLVAQLDKLKSLKDDAPGAIVGLINKAQGANTLTKGDIQDRIDALTNYQSAIKAKYENALTVQGQLNDADTAAKVAKLATDKKLFDDGLKSFIAYEEAKVTATIAGSDAERNAQIEQIKNTLELRKLEAGNNGATAGDLAKMDADAEREIRGLQLANYQHYLKGRTALEESYIAQAKIFLEHNEIDSIGSINAITDAEIEAIRRRKAEALSDPTLNPGERKKITEEANLAIVQLERSKQAKILEIQGSAINAQLILAQKGSAEELDFKLSALEVERKQSLNVAELTQEQINEINAKALKGRIDARLAFDEAQLQNQISSDNAALDQFGILENEKLGIIIKRLEEQRQLEILAAEQNGAKILEIDAKYDKLTREARLASNKAILDDNLKNLQVFGEASRVKNADILANANKYTYDQQKAANAALHDAEIISLDLSLSNLKKNLADKNITQEEYNLQYQQLLNERSASDKKYYDTDRDLFFANIDKKLGYLKGVMSAINTGVTAVLPKGALSTAIEELGNLGIAIAGVAQEWDKLTDEERKNKLKALATEGVAAAQDIINQAFADSSAKRNAQLSEDLANLEQAKAQELKVENLTAQQKSDIEQRFANQAKQIKKQAFEEEKRAKKAQAIINGLLGVSLAIAEYPWPYSLIVAGITAGFAAAQVAAINAQSPGFKDGVLNLKGPGTSTSDSINARLSVGESVIPADRTAKHIKPLTAIFDDKWDEYVAELIKPYANPLLPDYIQHNTSNVSIDYEKMGDSIAGKIKIPAPLKVTNNFDKNGWNTYVESENARTVFLNNRMTMP